MRRFVCLLSLMALVGMVGANVYAKEDLCDYGLAGLDSKLSILVAPFDQANIALKDQILNELILLLHNYNFKFNAADPGFNVRRTLESYDLGLMRLVNFNSHYIYGSYLHQLSKLGPRAHVMDLGAGQFVQIQEALTMPLPPRNKGSIPFLWTKNYLERPFNKRPNFTGVALTPVDLISNPKLTVLTGRFFEEIPVEELIGRFGKVDIATDYYGVLAYTFNLPLVIEHLSLIMKAGASLWVNKNGLYYTRFELDDGTLLTFEQFMASLPGWACHQSSGYDFAFEMKRTDEPLRLPRMELVDSRTSLPAVRRYRVHGNFPLRPKLRRSNLLPLYEDTPRANRLSRTNR